MIVGIKPMKGMYVVNEDKFGQYGELMNRAHVSINVHPIGQPFDC